MVKLEPLMTAKRPTLDPFCTETMSTVRSVTPKNIKVALVYWDKVPRLSALAPQLVIVMDLKVMFEQLAKAIPLDWRGSVHLMSTVDCQTVS